MVPNPTVITTDVAFASVQPPAATPPTLALQLAAPSCAAVMKLVPDTVIVLPTYPATAFTAAIVGAPSTVSKEAFDAQTAAPPLANVTVTF